MLEKRQSFDSIHQDPHIDKNLFFRYHMPELNEEPGRLKYYKAYEFAKKQTNLLQYWRRALNLYLKHFHKGFAVHWSDLIDFFDYKGSRPLGLSRILLELSKNKEISILKDETEFKKIARLLGNDSIEEEGSASFWKGVINFFKKNNDDVMEENTILVHLGYLTNAVTKVSGVMKNLFGDKILIEEKDFIGKFTKEFGYRSLDQKLLIQVLLDRKTIFKYKDKKFVFYCIQEPGHDDKMQFDIEKEEVLLNGRIKHLSHQLDTIAQSVEVKTKEALECKRRHRKAQAMTLLTELRQLRDTAEKLRNEKLFIENIKFKLVHSHSQKELADVLKDVNKILEGSDKIYDEIIKNHDQMKDLEEQNDYINHLLIGTGGKDDDLESMYKDLNELSVSKIINSERIRNLSADEERKDSSTSEAMRKSNLNNIDTSLKDINNLTDSLVLLKRFTNFEE